jgi:hypothetical protein
MKNILIIESCENIIDSVKAKTIVHVRNALVIQEYLKCDFISHISQIPSTEGKKYDAIICSYASGYMMYNKYLKILQENPQAKMFWMSNEHGLAENILLRKWVKWSLGKSYHMISNNIRAGYLPRVLNAKCHEKTIGAYIDEWYTVNLNTLIFDIDQYNVTSKKLNKFETIYYGTFRPNRIADMMDYNDFHYFLSTSTKNHKSFKDVGIKATLIDKLEWCTEEYGTLEDFVGHGLSTDSLDKFKYSLYFEDSHTHESYEFMANRFYEGVMNNTLMFYDHRCAETLRKSGYNFVEFQIVKNGKELQKRINILDGNNGLYIEILAAQQSNVAKILSEREKTLKQIAIALDFTEGSKEGILNV